MKKISLFLFVIFITMVLLSHYAYATPYFADAIIDYSNGTGLDFTGEEHISRALGPWDTVFVSIGETGYFIFSFDNLFVANEAGNDVRIYTTGHSISNEPAEIFASIDGINFLSLGILDQSRTSTWVASGPSYEIYYEEFDLSDAEINIARYIKVVDLSGGFVATDIDAVSILNNTPISEPATMILLGSLATGLFGMASLKRRFKR
jgi:hypothetical protein